MELVGVCDLHGSFGSRVEFQLQLTMAELIILKHTEATL